MNQSGLERRAAATVALIYFLLGLGWIVFSDRIIGNFEFTSLRQLTQVHTLTGLGFIALTSFLLYFLIKREVRSVIESEAKLNSLINNAPYGIFTTGTEGDSLQLVNPALVSMLGYASDEIQSLSVERDISVEPAAWAKFRDSIMQSGNFGQELAWKGKNGSPLKVYATGRRVTGDEGNAFMEVMVEDITERHKLEEELRQAQKLESIGSLASGVAHDFNNILMAIGGYAELLGFQIPEADVKSRYVDQILKAVSRGTGLSQQLLAFSRKQELRPVVLNANEVLSDAVSMLRPILGSHIRISVAPSLKSRWFLADKIQSEQVLLNLMINARDAMPKGGLLSLSANEVTFQTEQQFPQFAVKPGCYVVIAVSDSGMGMSQETQARIFEPFFTTKANKGTGLGLTTVFGIMKRTGGAVRLHSEVGAGTSFELLFPAVQPSDVPEAEAPLASTQLSSGTILLVDDEEVIREGLKQYLELRGYTVLQARDGNEALAILKQPSYSVDLLLSDVQLPGINGEELGQHVRTLRPKMKVLLMSGLSVQESEDRETHFIQKPFKLEALSGKLQQILASEG